MTKGNDSAAQAVALLDVTFAWPGRSKFTLEVPQFVVPKGEKVFLFGESGSGKSTLLSLIAGITAAQQGSVMVNGTALGALSGGRRDRFRAEHIGVIFQQFNLLSYASPLDNILLPLSFAPKRRDRLDMPPTEAALKLTRQLGLPNDLITNGQASDLSVGQQQRVAVARALIGAPELIIADEPTSALDAAAQSVFVDMLFEQVQAAGVTLLMVSHDERLAPRFDRMVRLSDIAQITRGVAQ